MVYVSIRHTMTNQLTEELVHWDLAEPPDGADVTEDEEVEEPIETPTE